MTNGAARVPGPPARIISAALAAAAMLLAPRPAPAQSGLSPGQEKYLCSDIGTPMFSEKSRDGGIRVMAPSRPWLKAREFRLPKRAGKPRVFIVGESVGTLLGDVSYGLLAALPGEAAAEVINCSMGAYDSGRLLAVFEELLSYEPDLLIVMSGNNELGVETCPGLRAGFERAKRAVKVRLQGLFSGARDAERVARLSIHRERLLRMARLAKEKGAAVVFCTLPANERDFPPYGQPTPPPGEAGLEALRRAARESPEDAFAHYRLARALEAAGLTAEAKAHYGLAIEWDEQPGRCSPARNAMIREAAAAGGACLADLEKDFSDIAGGGIVGGELISDGVHWHYALNGFVAARLWRRIMDCPGAARVFGSAAARAKTAGLLAKAEAESLAAARSPGHAAEAAKYSAYYAAAYLRTGLPGLRERAIALLDMADRADRGFLLKTLKKKEEFTAGMPDNLWANDIPASVDSWWPLLREAVAEMWRRKGGPELSGEAEPRAAAAPQAVKPLPGPLSAPYKRESARLSDSGVTKYAAGDLAGARSDLEAAVETDQDNISALLTLCSLHIRRQDLGAAGEYCGLAVNAASFPSPGALIYDDMLPDALSLRAEVYRLSGDGAKAAADLRAAISASSKTWPGRGAALEKLSALSPSQEDAAPVTQGRR